MRKKFDTLEELTAYFSSFDIRQISSKEDFQFLYSLCCELIEYFQQNGIDASFWVDLRERLQKEGAKNGLYCITQENMLEMSKLLAERLTPPQMEELLLEIIDWKALPNCDLNVFKSYALENNLEKLLEAVCKELCLRNPLLN